MITLLLMGHKVPQLLAPNNLIHTKKKAYQSKQLHSKMVTMINFMYIQFITILKKKPIVNA